MKQTLEQYIKGNAGGLISVEVRSKASKLVRIKEKPTPAEAQTSGLYPHALLALVAENPQLGIDQVRITYWNSQGGITRTRWNSFLQVKNDRQCLEEHAKHLLLDRDQFEKEKQVWEERRAAKQLELDALEERFCSHSEKVKRGVERAIDSVFDRYSFPNGYRCRIETCFGSFEDSKDLQDALSAVGILCQAGGNEDHQTMWCNPTTNAEVFTAIFDSLSAAFINSVTFAIPPAPSEPEVKP